MERIAVKCPKCENRMDIDPKVIAFRCSKCGEKIDLDDEPVKQGPVVANINVDRKEAVQTVVNKADIIRAKNDYKLERQRLRGKGFSSGVIDTWLNRKKPDVVYGYKKVGFWAGVVGVTKWLVIGSVILYVVQNVMLRMS